MTTKLKLLNMLHLLTNSSQAARRGHGLVWLSMLAIFLSHPARAQESLPPPPLPMPMEEDESEHEAPIVDARDLALQRSLLDSGEDNQELMRALIEQVKRQRQDLTVQSQANDKSVTHRGSSRAARRDRISRLRRDLTEQRRDTVDRSERLNQYLDRLQFHLDRNAQCLIDKAAASDTETPATTPVTAEPDPGDLPTHPPAVLPVQPSPVEPEATSPPTADSAADRRETAISQETEDTPASDLPLVPQPSPLEQSGVPVPPLREDTPESLIIPIAIVEESVDSLALANNVYGSGDYALALQIYQNLDYSKLKHADRVWVGYQIANCQRRLGNMQEAERNFRIVTSSSKDAYWDETARWWLDINEREKRIRERLQVLDQVLQAQQKDGAGDEQSTRGPRATP